MISYWFDTSTKQQITNITQTKESTGDEKNSAYCCAVCQQFITSESTAITVEGEHTHIKTNPDGRKYLLCCFSAASGCAQSGDPTSYFSWFAGYNWQFAHCSQCGVQLGWVFEGQNRFYGIIKEQLVPCHGQDG